MTVKGFEDDSGPPGPPFRSSRRLVGAFAYDEFEEEAPESCFRNGGLFFFGGDSDFSNVQSDCLLGDLDMGGRW